MMRILLLLFCMRQGVAMEILDTKPGIYEEDLGRVQLVAGTATVFFKIDNGELREDMRVIDEVHATIATYCSQAAPLESQVVFNSCKNFVSNSLKMKGKLSEKLDKMIVDRERRGLIDFVGSTEKFLFGTMDAKDKKKIKKNLDGLDKEQIEYGIVLSKAISSLNETNSVVGDHASILERHCGKIGIDRSKVKFFNTL